MLFAISRLRFFTQCIFIVVKYGEKQNFKNILSDKSKFVVDSYPHGGIIMERTRGVSLRYSGGEDPLCTRTLHRAEGLYG